MPRGHASVRIEGIVRVMEDEGRLAPRWRRTVRARGPPLVPTAVDAVRRRPHAGSRRGRRPATALCPDEFGSALGGHPRGGHRRQLGRGHEGVAVGGRWVV